MRAVAYRTPGPIDRADALVDVSLEDPVATGRDLLVEVKAIAVNPIDCKVRRRMAPDRHRWKVLGWDAAGIVRATGTDVRRFAPGDAVWYAGSIQRDGANSELHLVDERIVGRKPESLSFAEAAALPLTGITAWETLFDRMDITRPVPGAAGAVVIIGGAGGVASAAIQLVRSLTSLTVIATASRAGSRAWVEGLGAHHVIDHRQPLAPQLESLELGSPAFVFSTNATSSYVEQIAGLIAPQGRFGLIDDVVPIDLNLFKPKSVSLHWESMFTRSTFQTPDLEEQGAILSRLAQLVDSGRMRTTIGRTLRPINAAHLIEAHRVLESGTACGKIVLEGF